MVSSPAAFQPRMTERLSCCFSTSDNVPAYGTEREPISISVPNLCQARPSLPDVGSSLISFSNSCQPIESLGFDPNKEIGSLVNREVRS